MLLAVLILVSPGILVLVVGGGRLGEARLYVTTTIGAHAGVPLIMRFGRVTVSLSRERRVALVAPVVVLAGQQPSSA